MRVEACRGLREHQEGVELVWDIVVGACLGQEALARRSIRLSRPFLFEVAADRDAE